MNTSKFIAKIIGVLYMSAGLGYLVSADHYRTLLLELSHPSLVIFTFSVILIVAGLTVIVYHNIWEYDWRVWITIIGWLTLIKGVLSLIFPNFYSTFIPLTETPGYFTGAGIFSLALGLIFCHLGFFSKESKDGRKEGTRIPKVTEMN